MQYIVTDRYTKDKMWYNLCMDEKIQAIKTWLGAGSVNVFGIQFSGKDTVGHKLAKVLGAAFLSSGDIVRAARENSANQQIRAAAEVSDSGVLTPTDEFKELIVPYLYAPELDGKALILSTVGRWIGEEQPVMAALKRGGHDTKAVILLKISEDEVWQRWRIARDSRNGGRDDDVSEAKVQTRLDEFHNKTLPVIEIYRQMGILIEINGQQSRDQVFAAVIDKLYEFSRI
jgi:adenylate kinase